MMTRAENVKDYYKQHSFRPTFICNETGEKFKSFKSWCKRNGIHYSKYYLNKSLNEKSKYHGTEYSFTKITEEVDR